MQTVLYLHGFASSPAGRKIALLREALPADEYSVVAPDLNRPSFGKLDFKAIVAAALEAAEADPPAVVVGSSLGALAALEAARRGIEAPLVLVAPALGFGRRWIERLAPGDPIPFFHHGEGREIPIHRHFFEQMALLSVDKDPPRPPVAIVMGVKDESVPFEGVYSTWRRWEASGLLAKGSRFIAIPDGDHGLVDHVDRIAEEIRTSATSG
ncbi:MAG TPA: YqiA/YcfP family alpha/beta fold hydrolase [Thermoanaerobaculia bacterium]|nr:YqiA/YcfP family alpha/beta fold hydrolase [Thermoanaerobaculia bacterium]